MSAIQHGGKLDAAIAQYGGERTDWLDLSTGINPHSYPFDAPSQEAWTRLPQEQEQQKLLETARQYYRVPMSCDIAMANGTQAIIQALPHVFGVNEVTVLSPTYGEYAQVFDQADINVNLVSDVCELPENTELLVVVNPNNPDAKRYGTDELTALAKLVKHLIIDEAFCDPYPSNSLVSDLPENAIVLRSFGKFFGLAGVRLGFVIGSANIVAQFSNHFGPWAVSGPAIEVGTQALSDTDWVAAMIARLNAASQAVAEGLEICGLRVDGVNALFIYASHAQAYELYEHLARNQILVRVFDNLPDKLRFGLCECAEDLQRLESVLSVFTDE